ILKNKPYFKTNFLSIGSLGPNVLFINENPTLSRFYQTIKMFNQRTFSAARVADQTDKFPLGNLQVDMVNCSFDKGCSLTIQICQVFRPNTVQCSVLPCNSFTSESIHSCVVMASST